MIEGRNDGYESTDSVELETDITKLLGKGETIDDNEHIPVINGIWNKDERNHYLAEDDIQPYIRILEQPQPRGFRFRYECEGPSHGGLQGERSEKYRKTYPSIKIENYNGPARIVVNLVTDSDTPQPHAHKLVGKNCKNGTCVVECNGKSNPEIQFPNLCVQHVTRKKAADVLQQRILENIKLEKMLECGNLNAQIQIKEVDEQNSKNQANKLAKDMQLNVVRLCFQAYLRDDNGQFNRMLASVVSKPIYDSKSPGANALKICRMDKYGGCCTGGEEVFLLCEKVQKDDIDVRFVEQDDEGNVLWESYGNFGPFDVHRQFAIVFKTPQYHNTNIDKAVNVVIMLQRKSDKEVSDPKSFTYYPQNFDREEIAKKRKKILPSIGGGNFGPPGSDGRGHGMGFTSGNSNGSNFLTSNGQINGGLPTVMFSGMGNIPLTINQAYDTDTVIKSSAVKRGRPRNKPQPNFDLEEDSAPFHDLAPVNGHLEMMPEDFMLNIPPVVPQSQLPQLYPRGQTLGFSLSDVDCQFEIADGLDYVDAGSVSAADAVCVSEESSVQARELTEAEEKSTLLPPKVEMADAEVQTEKDNVIRTIERTTRALQLYSVTSDERYLLMVQRYLTNVTDENGDLPLHMSIINNQLPAMKNLLDVMVTLPDSFKKINAYNDLLQTPLHLAVLTNQPGVIDLLLCAGASPCLQDRNGNTPAHLAVQTGADDCLKVLLKYLRPGATQAKPFPELNLFNFDGLTPAHLAAKMDNFHAMKLLNYGKADVSLPDGKSGKLPLHFAVEADNLSVAGYLILEAGCNINAKCFDGNTALHIASGRGNIGMAALLMAAGADADMQNEDINENSRPEEDGEVAEGSDEESAWCGGLTPADFAQGNEKMIRVLRGEPYSSMTELRKEAEERDFRETTDMFTSLRLTSGMQAESGLGSLGMFIPGGDMALITYPTRIQLSHLLDPVKTGRDWSALADNLGMKKLLIGADEHPSPTRLVLDYFEEYGGTVARLVQALKDVQRMDAVNLINKLQLIGPPELPQNIPTKQTEISAASEKCVSEAGRIDSGLESMNLKIRDVS